MKTHLLLLSGILFTITAWGQQSFKTTPTSVIPYLEYLPSDYNKNSNKYPIVIFLHGIGERGPNTTNINDLKTAIALVEKHGPPKHVKNGTKFPFILISPQLKNNYGTWPTSYVMEVIEHVKTYLRVDERKIHITGMSLGGGGTWTMAQDYPELFASVAPICGGYNSKAKACNIASENIPVWAFHGDADPTVPLSTSKGMVDAINACSPTPNPQAVLSVYPGVKHDAWEYAYRPDHTKHDPNVYEWMMTHTNVTNGKNRIPVANAGTDKTAASSTYTLTGSGTDSDGSIVSYTWKKIAGPACSMSNANTAKLSLSSLNPGTYMFRLTVKDNAGATDSDYVKLTIQSAPLANAGSDITITLPASTATLKGSGTDSDGSISGYKWSFVSGPKTATISSATSATTTVSDLTLPGKYVFELEVKDNQGATGKDQVAVTVKDGTGTTANAAPVANAGKDVTITLPTSAVDLTGGGADSDGSVVAYKWSFVSGPVTPALTNSTAQKVSVKGLTTAGKYTLRLEVLDNEGAKGTDDVTVTVLNAPGNQAPYANAGADLIITLPTTNVTIKGDASDEDGKIVSYKWTQTSGPVAATLEGASTAIVKVTKLNKEGRYSFTLTVTDNGGATASDEVIVTVKADESIRFDDTERIDLAESSDEYWTDKRVVIYTETGSQIYQGRWNAERYAALLRRSPGLYIYSVMDDSNNRLQTGKLRVTP